MNEETQAEPYADQASSIEPINWTASEFIAHDKSPGWYGLLAIATVVLCLFTYVLIRDPITVAMIIIGAVLFGVYAGRQPRQLPYRLTNHGLKIGQRFYPMENFRSFAVVPEGAFSSIVLMPLRRFAPLTTIYFAPGDEDKIVELLSQQLPYAEHRHDAIDRLMRHIRF
jgi:hypothetical protein